MIYQGKQKIWSDYQKEIPDDHWFYVRSCIRQNFFPASEKYFLVICRDMLGRDIFETEHHTTCAGIAYHSDTIPQETAMTVVARQFALMTEATTNQNTGIRFFRHPVFYHNKAFHIRCIMPCSSVITIQFQPFFSNSANI